MMVRIVSLLFAALCLVVIYSFVKWLGFSHWKVVAVMIFSVFDLGLIATGVNKNGLYVWRWGKE